MPKRILFITRAMEHGGVEVSLLRLLNLLQKKADFEIDLLLCEKKGPLLDKISKNIQVHYLEYDTGYSLDHVHAGMLDKVIAIVDRFCYYLLRFINIKTYLCNEAYAPLLRHIYLDWEKEYDLAIDYHGYGAFTTALLSEKVTAAHKAMVIHDENVSPLMQVRPWLKNIDYFLGVTNACNQAFLKLFPGFSDQMKLLPNIVDLEEIHRLAAEDYPFSSSVFSICTIGRLEVQKGYDIALDAAERLKDCGADYCWYFVGAGSKEAELKAAISAKGLDKQIVLTGRLENPFPLLSKCNVYVQPSRHEGYGLAIEEALQLGIPVFASNLPSIAEHLRDGNDGLLLPLNAEVFAEELLKCMNNKDVLINFRQRLAQRIPLEYSALECIRYCLE